MKIKYCFQPVSYITQLHKNEILLICKEGAYLCLLITQAWSVFSDQKAKNLSEMVGMCFAPIFSEYYDITLLLFVYPNLIKRATCMVITFVLRKYFCFKIMCTPAFTLLNYEMAIVSPILNLFDCSFVRPFCVSSLSLKSGSSTQEKFGPSRHCVRRAGYWAFQGNLKKACCTCSLHSTCTQKAINLKEINGICKEPCTLYQCVITQSL